ncbi:MAG TPA: DUF2461 domain-containing protein [Actinomycetota bacterium]|nr:DUF2461 domain-containing protein [Actinomycetota bacterium]
MRERAGATGAHPGSGKRSFSPELFAFLRELQCNNDREWFRENRTWYVEAVQEPAIEFIIDFQPHLRRISRHFRADGRPVGGSLFRIQRDTRFSRDKTPYKTHVGIHFRHAAAARDVHGPGFYLHLEPGGCFVAVGVWHPDAEALRRVRAAIAGHPHRWRRAAHGPPFAEAFALSGNVARRLPAEFDPGHRFAEDLRRKDFVGVAPLRDAEVTAAGFLERFAERCRSGAPLVRFLCRALGLPF